MHMLAGMVACAGHFVVWHEKAVDTWPYLDASQVLTYGMYPKLRESTNTIPQRETVAGDAYCRSPTCKRQHSVMQMQIQIHHASVHFSKVCCVPGS